MAYIVPKELPKTCFECVFRQCKFSHPFWADRVPESERNKQGYFCSLDTQKPKRLMIVDFGDKSKKMEWCPLKATEDVVRCKKCKYWDKRDFKNNGICLQKKNPIFFMTPPDFYCACGERGEGE